MDSARHRQRRCAYSCLSRDMPSSMRSYVSSKLIGNLSNARQIADGKQQRRASSWQTTQRNLHWHVRNIMTWLSNDALTTAYMPPAFRESVSTTNSLSSSLHFRIFLSE